MRRTRRRRSTSSWVSPGPRVPMPPACWLSDVPPAAQPGQPVAQQGQLHLGLALLGCGRSGRRCRGSPRCGRWPCGPRIFSRLRCWAGRELVVEDHGVGVDRPATARAAPRPCPCPTKVAGSGRSRRWTTRATTSAPAVSTRRASSSRSASTVVGVGAGERPPRRARCARGRPRSIRRAGELRRSRQAARRGRPRTVGDPAHRAGRAPPGRPSVGPSVTSRVPPGLCTAHRGRRPGPSARAAAAAAQLPVPQARVSPTPRSHTRMVQLVADRARPRRTRR